MIRTLLACCVVLLVGTAGITRANAAPSASDVLAEVEAFYKDIKRVTVKFQQEVTNGAFGRKSKTDGKLVIKKPGKMRWDYYGKKTKTKDVEIAKSFISDGKYLYVEDRLNKQVIEKNLEKTVLPAAITFLYGQGDLGAELTAKLDTSKKYGKKGDLVLELTPKVATTQYETLYLVVDPSNYRVKESVVVDGGGTVNHFRFYEPNFKKKVPDSKFALDEKRVKNYRRVKDEE